MFVGRSIKLIIRSEIFAVLAYQAKISRGVFKNRRARLTPANTSPKSVGGRFSFGLIKPLYAIVKYLWKTIAGSIENSSKCAKPFGTKFSLSLKVFSFLLELMTSVNNNFLLVVKFLK